LDWTAEQVVDGYLGQQRIERVFRGLKEGDWLRWGPMYHWTDSKIRVHAFYCLLGISLLQSIHRQAQTAWPGISMEKLIDELGQIQQLRIPSESDVSFRQACVSRFRSGILFFQQAPNRCPTDTKPSRNLRFADSCEK
jgi:transposase